jgi:hypothetical protein
MTMSFRMTFPPVSSTHAVICENRDEAIHVGCLHAAHSFLDRVVARGPAPVEALNSIVKPSDCKRCGQSRHEQGRD